MHLDFSKFSARMPNLELGRERYNPPNSGNITRNSPFSLVKAESYIPFSIEVIANTKWDHNPEDENDQQVDQ